MRYWFVFFPIAGAILCFCAAVILHIRGQGALGIRKTDFFDTLFQKIDGHMSRFGYSLSGKTYVSIGLFSFAGLVFILFMSRQPVIIALGVGLMGFFVPEIVLRIQYGRRNKLFENRYAQALQQMASSLRSGLTIQQSVEDLCKSPFIHESIKESFRQISADLTVGISVKEAFMKAAKALQNEDALDVALSLSLQNELGGSEAKVVETVARNISNRILLRREIKSLFADTNITIITMDILPILIIFGLIFGSPQYIELFFQTTEMTILFGGIVLFTLIGSVVIRKVVKRGMGGK